MIKNTDISETFGTCNRERICACKQCHALEADLRWYEIAIIPFFVIALIFVAGIARLTGVSRN